LRAALIGTGRIASQHLACLRKLPGVELAAVADRSPVLAEVAADRFGATAWYDDHRRMLEEVRPDVVHVTTPPASHAALAADALDAGAHVLVEKPLAATRAEAEHMLALGAASGRLFLEDYNYLFNAPVRRLRQLQESGELGEVVHVEVLLALDILEGGAFVDPNLPNPALVQPGGAIMDFLPHLVSLAHAFVGPHREVVSVWEKRDAASPVPHDELRVLVHAERGTASLVFSAHAQPNVFQVRVLASRLRATAGLFEPRLAIERVRDVPRPLVPTLNALAESGDAAASAFTGLWSKLSGGPGSYEGLWELVARLYAAAAGNGESPISARAVAEVNALVWDIVEQEPR
jgi:predicted dehydrogenase